MYNLNQKEVRNFFFDLYNKANKKDPLSDLEKITYSVILEHPEYNKVLANKEKYLEYNWPVENGETNPFLHLSMHLSILEQLSIDQPIGIKDLYQKLCEKFNDKHTAAHNLIDCLGEMIWLAQKNNTAPDPQIYFDCINKKLVL
jgi:hypothetical protein